ncbi:hypothetical protein P7K49_025449 [Saguinus oedipus]|uniref:Uncharacterized protein n=1 Tax=Saguinus oedipus TaxID=9490 RepID=A0ABQ9UI06_SAGOE|nr:hypothetical protein P7K49_025449 [Saguinus oedipus]
MAIQGKLKEITLANPVTLVECNNCETGEQCGAIMHGNAVTFCEPYGPRELINEMKSEEFGFQLTLYSIFAEILTFAWYIMTECSQKLPQALIQQQLLSSNFRLNCRCPPAMLRTASSSRFSILGGPPLVKGLFPQERFIPNCKSVFYSQEPTVLDLAKERFSSSHSSHRTEAVHGKTARPGQEPKIQAVASLPERARCMAGLEQEPLLLIKELVAGPNEVLHEGFLARRIPANNLSHLKGQRKVFQDSLAKQEIKIFLVG